MDWAKIIKTAFIGAAVAIGCLAAAAIASAEDFAHFIVEGGVSLSGFNHGEEHVFDTDLGGGVYKSQPTDHNTGGKCAWFLDTSANTQWLIWRWKAGDGPAHSGDGDQLCRYRTTVDIGAWPPGEGGREFSRFDGAGTVVPETNLITVFAGGIADPDLEPAEEVADLAIKAPGDGAPCGQIVLEGKANNANWTTGERDFRITFDKSEGVSFAWPAHEAIPITDGYAAEKLVAHMASVQAANMDSGRRWVLNHMMRDLFVNAEDPSAVTGEEVGEILAAHGEPDCVPAGGEWDGEEGDPDHLDSDGDGIPDYADPDIDGDGIANGLDSTPSPYAPGGVFYVPPFVASPGDYSTPYDSQLPDPDSEGLMYVPTVDIPGPEIEGVEDLGDDGLEYELTIPIPEMSPGETTFTIGTSDLGEGPTATALNALRLLVRGFVLTGLLLHVGRNFITTFCRW